MGSLAEEKKNDRQQSLVENYIDLKTDIENDSVDLSDTTENCSCGTDKSVQEIRELFENNMDVQAQYPDSYYSKYIENFEKNVKKRRLFRFAKRTFDLIVSLFLIIILSPLLLIIAIAIKCDSKGPVLFKQKRVGKDRKEFNCYKFRSMRSDAPHECPTSILENSEQHITKVGRFIRRFSLDELPQLFCCVKGTMSLIGYRPLIVSEKNCNDMRENLGVFALRPGISGYAQVRGRDDVYYKNKAVLDAIYVKKASLWLDVKLIFKTFGVLTKNKKVK